MILYLDTSALVKRYVQEPGTPEVLALIDLADTAGSVVMTQVEMAAAFARAVRLNLVEPGEAEAAWNDFLSDWPAFARLSLTPAALDRASRLAWEYGLRGYDAVHFSAALTWQDGLETPITLATYSRELWRAAQKAGMAAWPPEIG